MQGICDLVAITMKKMHGLDVNPLTDIAICCGQTEAFAAAAFSSMLVTPHINLISFHLINPHYISVNVCVYRLIVWTVLDNGDEVILFDPCYETYEGCIKIAGGVPVSL